MQYIFISNWKFTYFKLKKRETAKTFIAFLKKMLKMPFEKPCQITWILTHFFGWFTHGRKKVFKNFETSKARHRVFDILIFSMAWHLLTRGLKERKIEELGCLTSMKPKPITPFWCVIKESDKWRVKQKIDVNRKRDKNRKSKHAKN